REAEERPASAPERQEAKARQAIRRAMVSIPPGADAARNDGRNARRRRAARDFSAAVGERREGPARSRPERALLRGLGGGGRSPEPPFQYSRPDRDASHASTAIETNGHPS